MVVILLKNALRSLKIQVKNYWGLILALFTMVIALCHTVITMIIENEISFQQWNPQIAGAICLLEMIRILGGKHVPFYCNPATIHFLYNSSGYIYCKMASAAGKIVKTVLFAFVLTILFFLLEIGSGMMRTMICLCCSFLSCTFGAWKRYNRKGWIVTYLISSVLFLLSFTVHVFWLIPFGGYVTFLVIEYALEEIDMAKYYTDCVYYQQVNQASRHKNMAQMQQLAAEHVARAEHRIKLYDLPLSHKNALFCKITIETLRTGKQVHAVLSALFIASLLLSKTRLFSAIPSLENRAIAEIISAFLSATFILNIRELYVKQMLSILEKGKLGQFLPYSSQYIIGQYAIASSVVLGGILLLLGLILATNPGKIMLSCTIILSVVIWDLWICGQKGKRLPAYLANMLVVLFVYRMF